MVDTLPKCSPQIISEEEAADIRKFSRAVFSGVALAQRIGELERSMPDSSLEERLRVFYREYEAKHGVA